LKRSAALAVLVLALLLFSAVPTQQSRAQTAYSEKLNVYIAGSSALWYFTFQGINGSSHLTPLENAPGLSWYNITALQTSGSSSDSQVFGPQGYNVFPVASAPLQGVLLSVGSDSYSDASAAASALGTYLVTQFVSSFNGTGTYRFYAPLSFASIAAKTLLTFVPTGAGGFADAIVASGFLGTTSPMVILEGVKSGSSFLRTLVVGSITAGALGASSRPNILGLFGTTLTSLSASAHSTSSTIQIRVLDGIMYSKDHAATVVNDTAAYQSSYALTLPASSTIFSINASVLQQPAQLLAYRTISPGVLKAGQKLAVTLVLTNLSPAVTLTKIDFADNWWSSNSAFSLDHGNYTVPSSIAPSGIVTPVYVLKYTGNSTGRLTIPASVITYSYVVGSSTFKGRAVLNPIVLSLGIDDAVVYSFVAPSGGYGKSVGQNQTLKVTVFNAGNEPASSVVVAGHSISGLGVNESSTVTVTQSAQGLTGTNITNTYVTTYKDNAGDSLQSTTNVATEVFSHTSMELGFPALTVSETMSRFRTGGTNVTLAFTITNRGSANATSYSAQGTLPEGLSCGKIKGNGTTCASGIVSLNFPKVVVLSTLRSSMTFNVTSPKNFILGTFDSHWTTSGIEFQGVSDPLGIPAGATVTKQFAPSQLFGGMTSTVSVIASNAGPFTFYNMTFGSSTDTFDTLSALTITSKTATSITAGSNSTLTYSATALSVQGSLNSSASTATFYFGGTSFTQTFAGPTVTIYKPLSASITTTPSSTIEGKPFNLSITITNPSGVGVTNVVLSIPVPSGLSFSQLQGMSIVGKNLTITATTLAAHSVLSASASAEASSGITLPFAPARLTFSYGGVTVAGSVPSGGIAIGENVTTRYILPIGLVLLVLVAAVYYVRKISKPSVPASPQ
jgi:hypothetical protein